MANDFAAMFESSPQASQRSTLTLQAGQLIEGTVIAISGGLVMLDIGSSADASMDILEFEERPVKVGDKIKATVSNPRKDAPVLTLSLGKGGTAINSATLQLALEGRTPVSGNVTASNKGGYTVDVAGTRAFCPISQIDASYVSDPEMYVGQTLDFLVTEIREGGRNVVLSRRKLLEDERRVAEDEMQKNLNVGAVVEGTVKRAIRHGAIIDLGGVEGFIPISELAHARIDSAEDVVTIGESVKAQVLSIERNEKGLSLRLSMKALEAPAERPEGAQAERDEVLMGKVIKHVPNGLIISTPKGEGLVPTRELSLAPGADHRRTYPIETELKVVVVSRDGQSGKLRFSVGRVDQVEERNNYRDFGKNKKSEGKATLGSLGDLMAEKFGALAAQAAKNPVPPQGATATPAPASKAPQKAVPAASSPKKDHSNVRRRGK